MHAAEALDVGTRVLARREPDLEPEEGVVKKVHSRADGCTAFHVRLVSGRDAEGAAVMGRSVESAGDLLARICEQVVVDAALGPAGLLADGAVTFTNVGDPSTCLRVSDAASVGRRAR